MKVYIIYSHTRSLLDWVLSVDVTSDSKYIVTASWNRSIKVFDFETKRLLSHFKDSHPGSI